MNVDFSEDYWGGAKKSGLLGSAGNQERRRFGIIWPVTGNLSPRNLEFYSSFRTILGKFRESWETPLTAWLAKGNPLGPKK